MALAVVAMFLATMGVSNVNAASPISIKAENGTDFDIMKGGDITATLTLKSQDDRFKKMDIFLEVNWPSDEKTWDTSLSNVNFDPLLNSQVTLTKEGSVTVKLTITCGSNCDVGDTNTVEVTGKSDPQFRGGPGVSGSTPGINGCGSSDCLTDTTPASGSSNITNTITITLTARTGYSHTLDCDSEHNDGDANLYQGNTYRLPYVLANTGWNTDNYRFEASVQVGPGLILRNG